MDNNDQDRRKEQVGDRAPVEPSKPEEPIQDPTGEDSITVTSGNNDELTVESLKAKHLLQEIKNGKS